METESKDYIKYKTLCAIPQEIAQNPFNKMEKLLCDALNGDSNAQNQLGLCYFYGEGIPQNQEEAVKWFQKAAEQGNTDAQCSLGYCYKHGNGITKNLEEAVKWYQKAAAQGDTEAQNKLAECYYFGEGIAKNKEEALNWLHKAANQGDVEALASIGAILHLRSVLNRKLMVTKQEEIDVTQAYDYFNSALEKGHDEAHKHLTQMLGDKRIYRILKRNGKLDS